MFLYMTVLLGVYIGGAYWGIQSFGEFFIEQFGWHLGYLALIVPTIITIALAIKPININEKNPNSKK